MRIADGKRDDVEAMIVWRGKGVLKVDGCRKIEDLDGEKDGQDLVRIGPCLWRSSSVVKLVKNKRQVVSSSDKVAK